MSATDAPDHRSTDPGPDDREFQDAIEGRRVALVHDWLNGMRGGEKVLETIAELFPGAPIYTLIAEPEKLSAKLRSHPIHTSFIQRMPLARSRYRHYLPLFPAAIESFDLTPFDLIISTSHCVAKGAVPGPDAVHLCYCHSPMRYVWDQEKAYFPEAPRSLWQPVELARSLSLSKLRLWDVASTPRVDGFWANSSFVARRIRRYYERDAEVLAPPVDVGAFRGKDGRASAEPEQEDYALAVSALVPYKRLDVAIRVCEERGMELRIVGTGPEEKRLRSLCRRHARLLGRVDGDELQRLYRGARLFLQPGVEDFGIATVEALAAGTPVVALGRGGVCDIVEDGVHGVLYDPPTDALSPETSQAALSEAIDKSLGIRFNYLELGARADSFSSDRFRRRLRSSIFRRLTRAT